MDPILDIRPVRADLFTYSLRAPGQPARLFDDCFGSADFCLHDAAQALSNYFERVELHAAGRPLGKFSLARLRSPHQRRQVLALVRARLSHDVVPSRWSRPVRAFASGMQQQMQPL